MSGLLALNLNNLNYKESMNGIDPISEINFQTFEERVRTSNKNLARNGRLPSPSHSAHSALIRTSLASNVKRAKKIRLFRNGDKFYKGLLYAVSADRFRTFDSLLAVLTQSPLCDKNVMPNGVRAIFAMDGTKITDISQLEDEICYVCASTQVFKKINYPRHDAPCWSFDVKTNTEFSRADENDKDEMRDFVHPKLITIVRNGSKPRKAVKVLLNKKTAHSFNQVLNDINLAIKLDTGAVKKIFTIDGRQITCLQDFFLDDSVFIAYGPERVFHDDFDLHDNEARNFNPNCSLRLSGRKTPGSPRSPRKNSLKPDIPKSNSANNSPTHKCAASPKSTKGLLSPKSPRKFQKGTNSNSPTSTNGKARSSESKVVLTTPPAEMTEKFKIGKMIGEGNFAVVKECVHRSSGKQFALKLINKHRCRGKEKMIENEVSILRRIKHCNIIQLIEEYETPDEIYLVMELIKDGDLFKAITTATSYTEKVASGMLRNLVSALSYLHSMDIVHRDVKPENILVCLNSDGTILLKLGDFGLSTEVTKPLHVVCGTPTYVAPEVIAETGYGVKIDIWACGVITYILLCGFPPFASLKGNQDDLFDKILSGKFEFVSPYWDNASDSVKDLITAMLHLDIDDRLSADEVLDHMWLGEGIANDTDMHSAVSCNIQENFSPRKNKFNVNTPGISVIATTALDKASRFFQGRRNLHLEEYQNGADEVF